MATLSVTVNVNAGGSPTTIAEYHNMLLTRRLADYRARTNKTLAQFLALPEVGLSGNTMTATPTVNTVYEGYDLSGGPHILDTAGSQQIVFRDCFHDEAIRAGANSHVIISRCAFDPNGSLTFPGAGNVRRTLGGTGTLKVYDSMFVRTPSDGVKHAHEVIGNLFDLPLPPVDSHVDFVDLTDVASPIVEGNVFIADAAFGIEHNAPIDYVNSCVWLREGAALVRGNAMYLSPVQPNSGVKWSGAAGPASAIVVGDRVSLNQSGNVTQQGDNVSIQDITLLSDGSAVSAAVYGTNLNPVTAITGQTALTVSVLLAQMEF